MLKAHKFTINLQGIKYVRIMKSIKELIYIADVVRSNKLDM